MLQPNLKMVYTCACAMTMSGKHGILDTTCERYGQGLHHKIKEAAWQRHRARFLLWKIRNVSETFIRSMLREMPELMIAEEVGDGLQSVRKAEELQPDLIILDIGLPSLNGIEAARRIRKGFRQFQNTISKLGVFRRCGSGSPQHGGARVHYQG